IVSTILSSVLTTVLSQDRLIMAQTLWRHGCRTPTGCYPTDPYQESFWGVPWGELTTGGMSQHFDQGRRLRKRYIEETGLLGEKYSRYETAVRSADTPRCIESGMSNLAGFYSDSPTYPLDTLGWPSSWTPIPVHSRPHEEDRELEAGVSCPRADQLRKARENQPVFQDFLASKWAIFASINANSGANFDVSMDTLSHMLGILRVERNDFNLTMPSWVTDQFYNELALANDEGKDFTVGDAGFGFPEDSELIRLRGGFMLKEFVKNLNNAVKNGTTTKYFAYSGHDTIQRALLMTLGVKKAILGPGNPDYASVVACELWMRNGEYYVKILFAPDSRSDLINFSSLLPLDCVDGMCPLSSFIDYSSLYIPKGEE
ncbi:hypothetical protein PMAYCL1PPCAC_02445, partial [Pristionchus mayeri]